MPLYGRFSVAFGRRMLVALTGHCGGFQGHSMTTASWQRVTCCKALCPNFTQKQFLSVSSSLKQSALNLPQNDPQKGSLVYIGTLTRMVRLVKLFSLSTSAVGVGMQPFLLEQVSNLHWLLATMVGGVAGFFVFVTPLLLHFVTKRYVTSIYLNRESGVFTASTYTFLLRERLHTFRAEDVRTPTVPGIFTTAKIHDKEPLFIDPNLFIDRNAYIHMMKYDQPLEWEVTEKQSSEAKPPQ